MDFLECIFYKGDLEGDKQEEASANVIGKVDKRYMHPAIHSWKGKHPPVERGRYGIWLPTVFISGKT